MDPHVEVQVGFTELAAFVELPTEADFQGWSAAVLNSVGAREAELSIRLVDEAEMTELNRRFRNLAQPTNVLSFPYEPLPGVDSSLIGDIVICAPVVEREARDQGKAPIAHWAHMAIHGILHLCGYDHQQDSEAEEMELLETEILHGLGFDDPYGHEPIAP